MENNRFFITIQRINSLLFLLLLLGGIGMMLFAFYERSQWQHRNQVVVDESRDNPAVELFVGDLEEVSGHDVEYVELQARERGGKFYSGGYDSQTRNLLFLRGGELNSAWLFAGDNQLIKTHRALSRSGQNCSDKEPVVAFYYEVVRSDSDGDGRLSEDDSSTIALSHPDGTGYREIETGVQRVVRQRVMDNGATLSLLVQDGRKVVIKRYSLRTFEKLSEKEVASLANAAE